MYAYGSGNFGCLYDHAAGPFDTLADAADAATANFEDVFDSDAREQECLEILSGGDRYTFSPTERARGAGADYIEVFQVAAGWSWE